MKNSLRRLAHQTKFIFFIILIFLSACSQSIVPAETPSANTQAQTQSPTLAPATATPSHTPTVTNTATPSPTPSPTPQPEIDPQDFDYSMLDVMQWEGEIEVSNVEKHQPGYIVEIKEGYKTVLYSTPMFKETLENEYYIYGLRQLDMPEGFKFELLETRIITGEDGRNITMGILRNASDNSGVEGMYGIVLSAENPEGEKISFTTTEQPEIMAIASIASLTGSLHRKDQMSSMLLLRNILKYQEEHGPFLAGETYSLREIADMQSDEFQRLFYYPDGTNITLDDAAGTLTNLLINTTRTAFRTPSVVDKEVVIPILALGTTRSDRETYGTRLKRGPNTGDVPENDVILTFKEGKNGEKSYYIDGDVMEQVGRYFLSFHLRNNLTEEELETSIAKVDEAYQKYLEWDRTRHRFDREEILALEKYLYGELAEDEEQLQRMYSIVRKIFPLIAKKKYFR